MIEFAYQTLAKIGYTHPLHPAITHVSVGLVMGAFVFGLGAWLFQRPSLFQTAHHCIILAMIALLPTVVLGYMDWQYFYGGDWLFPIKAKHLLGGLLLILLIAAVRFGGQAEALPKKITAIYTFCLITVIALGYFGGELVYGKRVSVKDLAEGLVREGAAVFNQNCSICHYTDTNESKIGPGLKELFKREKLPVSGRPVTAANIRQQLKKPFKKMPAFDQLPAETVNSLIAFLETL